MRILRLLLWLLPSDLRGDLGPELLETAALRWRDLSRTGRHTWGFWPRQWLALIRAASRLRWGSGILGGADNRSDGGRMGMGLDGITKDFHHGLRSLLARPGFTAVAVVTLGLGIGTTTAMFGAVRYVLLRELPYEDPDRIVVLRQGGRDEILAEGVSPANAVDLRRRATTLLDPSVAEAHGLKLFDDGRATSLRAWLVSEGFLQAAGAPIHLGRGFRSEEFSPGNEKVVILGYQTWVSRFGSDPAVVGRDIILDGSAHRVVGVFEAGFKLPTEASLWGPRPPQPWDEGSRASANLMAIARLAPGVSIGDARLELSQRAAELRNTYPETNRDLSFSLSPLREHLFGDVRTPLLLLLGAVGLVLLIAAANVAGLQLARGAGRSREYALRGALGASSGRVLRMVIVESLLLAAFGGVLGVAIGFLSVDLIRWLGPSHLPRIDELEIDGIVLTFAILTATTSALISGLAPAVRASRMSLQVALRSGSRGATPDSSRAGLRDRLVIAEIAVALVLMIGAGLLLQSYDRLTQNELGFEPENRLAAQVWAYDDDHTPNLAFFDKGVAELSAVPGVEVVGLTTSVPSADDQSLLSRGNAVSFTLDEGPVPLGSEPSATLLGVDSAYTRALGIPVLSGRSFDLRDHPEATPVAMVNDAFVRRYFPDVDPIGRRLTLDWRSGSSREIVGVISDVRPKGFESEPRPEIYVPLSQEPANGLTFVIKTALDPTGLIPAVQRALWSADPAQAIWAVRPLDALLGEWTRQRRFNTVLLLTFAGLAMCLSAIGVYGLMAYSVEQRVKEMGIRRALGGESRDILGMVLRQGIRLAAVGIMIGLGASLLSTQLLRGMLWGISPFDALTFAGLSIAVLAVAVLAALIPGRRAVKVDPMAALRRD